MIKRILKELWANKIASIVLFLGGYVMATDSVIGVAILSIGIASFDSGN